MDGPTDGAENMARDRAVQLQVDRGDSPPTLRLYSWTRPTITLGRFQSHETVDRAACAELGIDVVRRFTGGRGVLHDDEITYSVVARTEDGVPRGVARSYKHLCQPLAEAYRRLGVPAKLTERDRGTATSAACYLATTRADLAVGEKKLSGSAQVWHGSTVLQHGSFTFSRDTGREARAFRLTDDQRKRLEAESETLESALGRRPSAAEVVDSVTRAFEAVLGIALVPGTLDAAELSLVPELLAKVYADGTVS